MVALEVWGGVLFIIHMDPSKCVKREVCFCLF